MPTSTYFVDIVEIGQGKTKDKTVKSMGPMTRWKAEKVQTGASINLDRERFYAHVRRVRGGAKCSGQM